MGELRKARVVVVMGGKSTERAISVASGTQVSQALAALGYDVHSIDYDERFIDAIRTLAPDAVFNALHGPGGEDGELQGVLDHLGIAYTGSGIAACALAMDKHMVKKLFAAEGLPTPAWDHFDLDGGALPLLPGSLDLPLVVKPRAEGSSFGVRIVRTHEQWSAAVIELSKQYTYILAEEFISGREFTCAVLGDEALPIVEIVANRDGFYSTDAKYEPGGSTHIAPAKIDGDLASRMQMLALSAHRLLGMRDCSRTDFIVSEQNRPYLLEINALPGLTENSLLPDAAAAIGIGFDVLVERILGFALARARQRNAA
ncbi:MAG TPA: D-alanine--D-alanine ligase [Candidatus Dormibacteraeota bacterium]|nr:D-alanine--D-alanine ligase [Candidatus Dormibacteraeota bacterium]